MLDVGGAGDQMRALHHLINLISPLYAEINYTTINIGHADEEHYVSTFWIINSLTFINESSLLNKKDNRKG